MQQSIRTLVRASVYKVSREQRYEADSRSGVAIKEVKRYMSHARVWMRAIRIV